MQMLRNFVGCDYSTDEGTDSEDEQVSGGKEHVGTGGEIKRIESEKGRRIPSEWEVYDDGSAR
jgi:hypothetical protein